MHKVKISGITIERLLQVANMFKGFKKKVSVLKELDGKYVDVGIEMKKKGLSSTDLIREIREAK